MIKKIIKAAEDEIIRNWLLLSAALVIVSVVFGLGMAIYIEYGRCISGN